MHSVSKVVMFTFESIYTRKVGGLAEVPPRLGKALVEQGVEVEVFTPNHGCIDACRNPVFSSSKGGFCISLLENTEPRHYVVGGGVLDDPVVYSPQLLLDKSLAFAKAVADYLGERLKHEQDSIVFHGHDWHSYPALLAVNAISTGEARRSILVYHVHLSSKTRIHAEKLCSALGVCGETFVRGVHGIKPFSYYYSVSGGLVEKLAALTVDAIVTVSRGYSKSLERTMGPSAWYRVSVVPNASPVSWSEVKSVLARKTGVRRPEDPECRLEHRKWLLTKGIKEVKLTWGSAELENNVKKLLDRYGVEYSKPFDSDGPLVFAIGRLAKQKGFDTLLKALDMVTLHIPRARVVLAVAPLEWSLEDLRSMIEASLVYEENLRVLPGMISREDAIMFYYASNTTLVPSRSEPFGLVALESMASGTPVAASRVEGLLDVVLDVRSHGPRGTGVLFEPLNPVDLAQAVSILVELVERAYKGDVIGLQVRESCVKRSEEFNWRISALKALEVYTKLHG
ncbi:MAG: glycosyltransferase [Desulfurococcaceae archaeon]